MHHERRNLGSAGSLVRQAMKAGAFAAALIMAGAPLRASTYAEVKMKCPVGGEKFKYMDLASISTWGALPDGMPLGSGQFPTVPPQCPSNGLVLYRKFTAPEVVRLAAWVSSAEFKALRAARETPYYLAYQTAKVLGDKDLHWLLLQAGWEAKNDEPAGSRARRYNEEFLALATAVPVDPASFESIATRVRAANALRELGRFEEAEALRATISIAPTAGGDSDEAAQNRKGWTELIAALAAPIARKEDIRAPIDMVDERLAVSRCLGAEVAKKFKEPPPAPLSAFEQSYCTRPELAGAMKEQREWLKEAGS